jgi:RNA polymerase sigma factor (sigma-70 family)
VDIGGDGMLERDEYVRGVRRMAVERGRVVTGIDNDRLLAAAASGDQHAWEMLVDRYADLVWSVARSFRLGPADAADVSQTTWLRLVEHLTDIRDSDRLGAWLATTARREALTVLRRSGHIVPTGDAWRLDLPDPVAEPLDGALLRTESAVGVRRAFVQLSQRCQQLLRVLLADPAPSYAEVGAALGMPIGSIGPARARCLDGLRRRLAHQEGQLDGR